MNTYRGIVIKYKDQFIVTKGLEKYIGKEFRIFVLTKKVEQYFSVMTYLVDYVLDNKPSISSEQTIAYHSWLLQMNHDSDSYLDLWEAGLDGNGFVKGVDYSISVISEQLEECKRQEVAPLFPTFNQKIVISKGVYEGLGVDAVRYPSPDHMTGWWITTEEYDDHIDSLMTVHYFHVAFKRPDLVKYFALPYGFRFYITETEKDVWYDQEAIEQ